MSGFNEWLGLEAAADGAAVELETRPEHEVMPGTIHFAVLATVAEVAAARAAGAAVVPAGIDLHLLRRARAGRLIGRGRVLKRGRRLAVVEGAVYQAAPAEGAGATGGEEKLVAKATVTFALI